jgi:hypothetical protein
MLAPSCRFCARLPQLYGNPCFWLGISAHLRANLQFRQGLPRKHRWGGQNQDGPHFRKNEKKDHPHFRKEKWPPKFSGGGSRRPFSGRRASSGLAHPCLVSCGVDSSRSVKRCAGQGQGQQRGCASFRRGMLSAPCFGALELMVEFYVPPGRSANPICASPISDFSN